MASKYKFDGWFADFNFKPKRKTNRGWFNINYKYSREMMLNLNPDPSKIPDFNSSDSMYNTDYDFEKANKRFEISLSNEMNKNPMDGSGGSTTTNGTCYYDAIDESISYNKGASFFDNLTNTDEFAKDEWWNMRKRAGYGNWKHELKINQETFGPIALVYAYSHRRTVPRSQPVFPGYHYQYANQQVPNQQVPLPPYYPYMGVHSRIPGFKLDSRHEPYSYHQYSRPFNRMHALPLRPLMDARNSRSSGGVRRFDNIKFPNPLPRSQPLSCDYRYPRSSWI